MDTVKQYNQEPSSIKTYINALVAIFLLVTTGTAAFLFWMDVQSQKTIQTSNKFHMATIIHINNIKHDLQQMESLLVHGDISEETPITEGMPLSSTVIEAHLARIELNIGALIKLREIYGSEEFKETISARLSARFNQFKSSVERGHPGMNLGQGSIQKIFRPMRITLLQLERLHLAFNSENLEVYRDQKGAIIRNFLALVAAILIAGLFAVTRTLSRVNQILKERIEDRLSLEETNLFLSSVLESSSKNSIVATDLKGMITYWNKGAERMFEYSSDEVVGKQSINILYPEGAETKDVVRAAASRILDNDEDSITCEVREKTKSGKIIWVNMVISKRLSKDEKLVGILGIGEDITSRKNLEQ